MLFQMSGLVDLGYCEPIFGLHSELEPKARQVGDASGMKESAYIEIVTFVGRASDKICFPNLPLRSKTGRRFD